MAFLRLSSSYRIELHDMPTSSIFETGRIVGRMRFLQGRRYGGPRWGMPPRWGGWPPRRRGILAVFVGDSRMGQKGKTEQNIHFASSLAITYPHVLTINALRDAGLQ